VTFCSTVAQPVLHYLWVWQHLHPWIIRAAEASPAVLAVRAEGVCAGCVCSFLKMACCEMCDAVLACCADMLHCAVLCYAVLCCALCAPRLLWWVSVEWAAWQQRCSHAAALAACCCMVSADNGRHYGGDTAFS
jgi:hypothetical protein